MRVLKFIRDIELGHRALSSAFIEDSSRPDRGRDITHRARNARSHREYNDVTTKMIKDASTSDVLRVFNRLKIFISLDFMLR